jgi:hypothetical protein
MPLRLRVRLRRESSRRSVGLVVALIPVCLVRLVTWTITAVINWRFGQTRVVIPGCQIGHVDKREVDVDHNDCNRTAKNTKPALPHVPPPVVLIEEGSGHVGAVRGGTVRHLLPELSLKHLFGCCETGGGVYTGEWGECVAIFLRLDFILFWKRFLGARTHAPTCLREQPGVAGFPWPSPWA